MNRRFRLGRILGVDVEGDVSFVLLAGLLVWYLWAGLRLATPNGEGSAVVLALVGGFLFFGGVLIHELSHSVVAKRRGVPVHRIRLFIFGGVSELDGDAITAEDELAISIAGPLASLVLGGVFLGVAWAVPVTWSGVDRIARILGIVNLALAGFNLIPGFPLDGGRVLRSILWRLRGDRVWATRIAVRAGSLVGLALVGAGLVMALRPGGLVAGIWYLGIGWYLHRSAASAGAREVLAQRVDGLSVRDVMRKTEEAVPGTISVAEMLDRYAFGGRMPAAPVEVGGRVLGIVGDREVESLSDADRATRSVAEVMTVIGPADVVEPTVMLEALLQRPAGPARRAVVVEAGRVVGLVTGTELAFLWE